MTWGLQQRPIGHSCRSTRFSIWTIIFSNATRPSVVSQTFRSNFDSEVHMDLDLRDLRYLSRPSLTSGISGAGAVPWAR
jgi:hypothetical protein